MNKGHHRPYNYPAYYGYGYGYDPYLYDRYNDYQQSQQPQQPQIVVIKQDEPEESAMAGWGLQIPTIIASLFLSYLIWGRGK